MALLAEPEEDDVDELDEEPEDSEDPELAVELDWVPEESDEPESVLAEESELSVAEALELVSPELAEVELFDDRLSLR